MKCSHWFFRNEGSLFRKNQTKSTLWLNRSKVCDAKIFSCITSIERCSADRKLLIDTMIKEIEDVLRIIESFYQDGSYKTQLLRISKHKVSFPRNQTRYWTVHYHSTSKKTSTETLIEEM